MNPKEIIQVRIDELQKDMDEVVQKMKEESSTGGASMLSMKQKFERVQGYKDQVLGLRSAIAELKNIKELV